MKLKGCEYEQEVVKSLASEHKSQEIAEHTAQCADCRETMRVAAWMKSFAAMSQPSTLPRAGFILWKAQLREKQTAANRATQPIVWSQRITAILIMAGLIWGLVKNLDQLTVTFGVLTDSLEMIAAHMFIALTLTALIGGWIAYNWRESPSQKKKEF